MTLYTANSLEALSPVWRIGLPVPKSIVMGLLACLVLAGCSPSKYSSSLKLDPASHSGSASCSNPYRVVAGDTLSQIALRCNVNMTRLAEANELMPPYFIRVNQKLVLPDTNSQKTRSPVPRATAHANWQWPMDRSLQHRFIRDGAGLSALEIYGLPGLPVKAVAKGEVVYAGSGISHYGLMVMIKHPNGYLSTYAHNSRLLVSEGQQVNSGQPIAALGASGLTDRPKLYLEARYQGKKVDAKKLLN
jgi:lipoprotein NlpD